MACTWLVKPDFVSDANEDKADIAKDYIAWAIGKGYAVIDVNIPKHVTTEPVSISVN